MDQPVDAPTVFKVFFAGCALIGLLGLLVAYIILIM